MTTERKRAARKRHVRHGPRSAKRKQTLNTLPKKSRRAVGREGAKARA